LNPFYNLIDTTFVLNLFGYIFGVGFTEELVKLLPLLLIYRFAKEPLQRKRPKVREAIYSVLNTFAPIIKNTDYGNNKF